MFNEWRVWFGNVELGYGEDMVGSLLGEEKKKNEWISLREIGMIRLYEINKKKVYRKMLSVDINIYTLFYLNEVTNLGMY